MYMPRMDAVMEHAKILKWLKREGERVAKGESLALAEGEKTTFEIPAPVAGQLLRSFPKEGTDVPVGDAIAVLGDPGETIPPGIESTASAQSTASFRPAPQLSGERRNISPAARRLAQEQGVDLTLIVGTGPGGSVIR
ncbi:MAG: E3 binding domain-containing protein, partial [Candidatus Bathyarchaeia archaeon]